MTDRTDPSTANVKFSQPLQPDGLNLPVWLYDVINCGISKNCVEAFKDPLHGTKANSAAINLLTSSTAGEFHSEIASCPSTCDALAWICNRFQGGHNRAINGEWFWRFTEEGMTRTETLDQYAQRKVALFRNLQANQHPMHPDDLPKYFIQGLPAEFKTGRTSLYAPCAGGTPNSILQVLRLQAHGIGINDRRPCPDPKAAITTVPPQEHSEKSGGGRGMDGQGVGSVGNTCMVTSPEIVPRKGKAAPLVDEEPRKPHLPLCSIQNIFHL